MIHKKNPITFKDFTIFRECKFDLALIFTKYFFSVNYTSPTLVHQLQLHPLHLDLSPPLIITTYSIVTIGRTTATGTGLSSPKSNLTSYADPHG